MNRAPELDTTKAYYVQDVEGVDFVNAGDHETITVANDVTFHDARIRKRNPVFTEQIEHARRKLCGPESIKYEDEVICRVSQGIFGLRFACVAGRALYINGSTPRILDWIRDPESPAFERLNESLRAPREIAGTSIVFNGIGNAGNYYHWTGEFLPRLALLRKHSDLSEFENIVAFARRPASFVEETIRVLFPDFKGAIHTLQDIFVRLEDAVFFVPRQVAARTETSADRIDAALLVAGTKPSWGSLPIFRDHVRKFAARHTRLVKDSGHALVVSRDKAPRRRWQNEDRILDMVSGAARKIYAEDHTIAEQISLFGGARVVIAQHGAGLANILYCKPGTRVIEITSRNHSARAWDFAKLGIVEKLDYHVVVVDAADDIPNEIENAHPEALRRKMKSDLVASEAALSLIAELATEPRTG